MDIQELNPDQQKAAEISELASLTEKGFHFQLGKRKFYVKEPFLGTLDRMSDLCIRMDFDINLLQTEGLAEGKRLSVQHAKASARFIAIAVLNGKWKIRFFARMLAAYFYWSITPSKLLGMVQMINLTMNVTDFIHSIVSMSANRTTRPETIEQNQKA